VILTISQKDKPTYCVFEKAEAVMHKCRESVRDVHLRGLVDVQRLSHKLAAKKISLQELCQLYMASCQLPAIVDALSTHTGAPLPSSVSTLPRVWHSLLLTYVFWVGISAIGFVDL
jgi:DNA mismatch repair ATPase MutS